MQVRECVRMRECSPRVTHSFILSGAAPLQTLHDAQDNLEMRILRKETNRREEEEDGSDVEYDENGERRQVFTQLSALPHGDAPIVS